MRRVVDSSSRMARNEVRHRARLVKNYGEVPSVEGSDSRIGHVVLNLIVNAAQAPPDGRADRNEIRLTTRTAEDGRAVIPLPAAVDKDIPNVPAESASIRKERPGTDPGDPRISTGVPFQGAKRQRESVVASFMMGAHGRDVCVSTSRGTTFATHPSVMNQTANYFAVGLVGLVVSACAASTPPRSVPSLGVAEMQPNGSCLGEYLHCTQDTDCCSGTCAAQVCSNRSR